MINKISFKTKFGWFKIFENKGKIIGIKEGKCKNKQVSPYLKKFKKNLINYFNKKNKLSKFSFDIIGNPIQKKNLERIIKYKTR